ncbi:MAG TPA: BrnT family toxin [Bryobacteraceae bacterium]|nr:BrnT family toxin [Bryobacteraceae bacterium]
MSDNADLPDCDAASTGDSKTTETRLFQIDYGNTGEQRWQAIGAVRSEPETIAVLFIVHVYREEHSGEEIIRIISARGAEKHKLRNIRNRQLTVPGLQEMPSRWPVTHENRRLRYILYGNNHTSIG